MGCKKQGGKIGSGFFLLFRKRRSSLASSLLNCKLQAEKNMEQTLKKYQQINLINQTSECRLTGRLSLLPDEIVFCILHITSIDLDIIAKRTTKAFKIVSRQALKNAMYCQLSFKELFLYQQPTAVVLGYFLRKSESRNLRKYPSTTASTGITL